MLNSHYNSVLFKLKTKKARHLPNSLAEMYGILIIFVAWRRAMWKYTCYQIHFITSYLNNSFRQKARILVGSSQFTAWQFFGFFNSNFFKQTPKISYSFCQLLKSKQA